MHRALIVLAVALLAACGATATRAPTDSPALPTAEPTSRITPEPTEPPDTSSPADQPGREEAYQQLLVSIPFEMTAKCVDAPRSEKLEAGELARAECTLPSGFQADYVDYKLFDGHDSMAAYFDGQRARHENAGQKGGPGCGKGPGEGMWDNGSKDCFSGTEGAEVVWTHDELFIEADAFRRDGNFARLETFWTTAGPVTP